MESRAAQGGARRAIKAHDLAAGLAAIRHPGFPGKLLKRSVLLVSILAHQLGLRDLCYLIGTAATFRRYWDMAAGEFELPADAPGASRRIQQPRKG